MDSRDTPPLDPVETALMQFSTAFTVRDLMTPREALVCADSATEAHGRMEKHGYDVIPSPCTGPLTGYYEKSSDLNLNPITPSHLVSNGTSLLDLLPLFVQRDFYFVLQGTEIRGYVHFSDLNKPIMRTPLYLLLVATERHLLSLIRETLPEDDIKRVLHEKRVKRLASLHARAMNESADITLWDVLGLPDILAISSARSLARVNETEQISDSEAKEIVKVRNSVAHSGLLLVDGTEAVQRLIRVRKLCEQLRLLNGVSVSPNKQN